MVKIQPCVLRNKEVIFVKKLRRNVLLGMALTAASGLSVSAVSADAAGQPGGNEADRNPGPGISVVSSAVNPELNPTVYGPPDWFRTDPEEETFDANEDVYGPPDWFEEDWVDLEEETYIENEAVYGPPDWFGPGWEQTTQENVTVYGPPEWFENNNNPVSPEDDITVPDYQGTPSAGIGSPFRVLARMIAFLGSFLRFLYHGK